MAQLKRCGQEATTTGFGVQKMRRNWKPSLRRSGGTRNSDDEREQRVHLLSSLAHHINQNTFQATAIACAPLRYSYNPKTRNNSRVLSVVSERRGVVAVGRLFGARPLSFLVHGSPYTYCAETRRQGMWLVGSDTLQTSVWHRAIQRPILVWAWPQSLVFLICRGSGRVLLS